MKKNLALAMIAFVFAVGSAVASKTFVDPEFVFVHAQFGDTSAPIICLNTQVKCTQSTSNVCQVTVNLVGGGTGVASSNGTNKTYQTGCTTILGNPSFAGLTSPITQANGPDRLTP